MNLPDAVVVFLALAPTMPPLGRVATSFLQEWHKALIALGHFRIAQ